MSVFVKSGSQDGADGAGDGKVSPFNQRIKVGKHSLVADEPEKVGGLNQGPSPYDLLLSALGACTNMTIKMYAERKGIPLEGVSVELEHSKVYAKDCAECAEEVKEQGKLRIDHISREITLHGAKLSDADRANCLRIANMCPVHKTLEQSSVVTTKLKELQPPSATPAELLTHISAREAELSPGFTVRRVIPFRNKRAVGPWVFCDHYGPVDVSGQPGAAEPMDVGPHPHIGIATLSYLFSGAILHRDSLGVEQVIKAGQVNYMSSGRGVVHAERGWEALCHFEADPAGRKMLHGLQVRARYREKGEGGVGAVGGRLGGGRGGGGDGGWQMWIGLPKEAEDEAPSFHHAPQVPDVTEALVEGAGGRAELVVGRMAGAEVGEVPQRWPIFMLALHLPPGAVARVPLIPHHEACVYTCLGRAEAGPEQSALDVGESAVYAASEEEGAEVVVRGAGAGESVVAVFGGLPLPEKRHMFWNFAHSDRAQVQAAAAAWRALDRSKFPEVVGEDNQDSIPLPSTANP